MKPARTLNIERLVLHGFSVRDRAPIVDAFRTELQRLFAENAPQASAHMNRIDAGEIAARPGDRPERAGMQAAQRLYHSLGIGVSTAGGSTAAPRAAAQGADLNGGRS